MRHSSLPSSRSVARCVEALDLAHHLLDSPPRFVKNLCEEFRLVDSVRAIGDYRADAAFTRHLPVCLPIIALVCDNGAGIDIGTVRETGDRIERETRFYIKSLALLALALGPLVRDHWAVENGLHWIMDMVLRDDECRVRKDHAPVNFTTINHMTSNLMRNATAKGSMRLKRKAAAWDDNFLASLAAE